MCGEVKVNQGTIWIRCEKSFNFDEGQHYIIVIFFMLLHSFGQL